MTYHYVLPLINSLISARPKSPVTVKSHVTAGKCVRYVCVSHTHTPSLLPLRTAVNTINVNLPTDAEGCRSRAKRNLVREEREKERDCLGHTAHLFIDTLHCLLVYALWKKNSETKAVYLYCTCQNTDLSVVDGRALLDRCVQWQKEGRGLDLCLRKLWTM